jgi:hypothetical protein
VLQSRCRLEARTTTGEEQMHPGARAPTRKEQMQAGSPHHSRRRADAGWKPAPQPEKSRCGPRRPGEARSRCGSQTSPTRQNQTIRVVEVSRSPIHWMEPRDLSWSSMNFAIDGCTGLVAPSSKHPGGFQVLQADGTAGWLPQTLAPDQLRARLTIAGGEPVRENF